MSQSLAEHLIVFTRYPEPGATKTRLVPALGAVGAADLQRRMTEHTLDRVGPLLRERGLWVELRFEGGDRQKMSDWLALAKPEGLEYAHIVRQEKGNLGRRMRKAFVDSYNIRACHAVIVGADAPGLTAALVARAFEALKEYDLVLGPATDGGYYLIGLKEDIPKIFEKIPWGTDLVRRMTIEVAKELGLRVYQLDPLDDVDRPEDLDVWRRTDSPRASAPEPISVVIPTLNEAAYLEKTIERVKTGEHVEVIVSDGGSDDYTRTVAESLGARVVKSPRGRGVQMNVGAARATGDILLFCHADTLLPRDYDQWARLELGLGAIAGAFELRIDGRRRALRRIEAGANWRTRVLGTPYGDQGLFLRTRTFRKLGGYANMPLMEDLDIVRRLGQRGRIALAGAAVLTSDRRYRRKGAFGATLLNQFLLLGYHAGVPPHRLARWYYG